MYFKVSNREKYNQVHLEGLEKQQPTCAPLALNFSPHFTQSHPFVHIDASA